MTPDPHQQVQHAVGTIRAVWDQSADPPTEQHTGGSSTPRSRLPGAQITLRADTHRALRDLIVDVVTEHPAVVLTVGAGQRVTRQPVPTGDVPTMCVWVQTHGDTIAELTGLDVHASRLAGCARALHNLVHQPDRDRPPLGLCDRLHTGEEPTAADAHVPRCNGTVRAIPERNPGTGTTSYDAAACTRCGTDATIQWWMHRWGKDRGGLVTTTGLVHELHAQGIDCTESTIRVWLHRGVIYAAGTTPTGERLWDPTGVVAALTIRDNTRASHAVGKGAAT